jgi:hypothetical protein
MIVAPSAGGKTVLLMKMLNKHFSGKYDEVFLICPTWKGQECYRKLKIKEDNKYDTATNETFNKIMEKVNKNREQNKHSLVILDDWLYSELSESRSSLSNNILHLRHKWCSIILLSQYYKAIRPEIRTNMSHVVIFKNDSEKEIKKMQDEYGDQWREFYNIYTVPKYGYVFADFEKSIYDNRYSNETNY